MSLAKEEHPVWNKGIHWSEETRKRMSLAHKGHPATNQIKISIEGVVFESFMGASKYYNVSVTAIRYWLKNKKHNAFYIEK